MSKTTNPLSPQDLLEDFDLQDDAFVDMAQDPKSEAYAEFLRNIRITLMEDMQQSGINSAELSRMLGVSKSVISRIMNPDSDLYASTVFDIAWALNKEPRIVLQAKFYRQPIKKPNKAKSFDSSVKWLSAADDNNRRTEKIEGNEESDTTIAIVEMI